MGDERGAVRPAAHLHRGLEGLVLGLDRDDAPGHLGQLGLRLGLGEPVLGDALQHDLRAAVEDDVQHLGLRERPHRREGEPPREHGELPGLARVVPAPDEVLVLRRDRQAVHRGPHEVGHEDVLAERRVPVREAPAGGLVQLVHPAHELRLGHLGPGPGVVGVVPLPLGEGVQVEGPRHQALPRRPAPRHRRHPPGGPPQHAPLGPGPGGRLPFPPPNPQPAGLLLV